MIKNIIFDVGDVLLDYRAAEMLMDYGMTREDALALDDLMFYDPLWHELDLGVMTQEEVIKAYQEKYPEDAETIAWFIENGEQMHVARPKVWEKIRGLKKKGYGIYLLSNYSKELFRKHTKDASFMDDIDGMVVSYQVHMTKPEEGIYRYLLETYQLNAMECIFFDDRAENVDAAKKIGMSSVQITSQEVLLDQIEELLK